MQQVTHAAEPGEKGQQGAGVEDRHAFRATSGGRRRPRVPDVPKVSKVPNVQGMAAGEAQVGRAGDEREDAERCPEQEADQEDDRQWVEHTAPAKAAFAAGSATPVTLVYARTTHGCNKLPVECEVVRPPADPAPNPPCRSKHRSRADARQSVRLDRYRPGPHEGRHAHNPGDPRSFRES